PLDQHLAGKRAAFPALGARTQAVSARAEDSDEVAFLCARQLDLVAEHVERRAQATGDGDDFLGWRIEAIGERDRVIDQAAFAEAAGRADQVMAAAIGR